MSERDLPRRDFLKTTWSLLTTLAAVGSGYIGLSFLNSRDGDGDFGGVVIAGMLDDFPPGTVTPITEARCYLVRLEDGGLLALYRKCTHLDCVVLWNEKNSLFSCPCHGSEFEPDGNVLNPPAPRPLAYFPVTLENGQISVDTGTLIDRAEVTPDAIFYPTGETS